MDILKELQKAQAEQDLKDYIKKQSKPKPFWEQVRAKHSVTVFVTPKKTWVSSDKK